MTSADPAPVLSSQESKTTCASCGTPVETDEWHPAATTTSDEGDIWILSFCDRDCRDRWEQRRE